MYRKIEKPASRFGNVLVVVEKGKLSRMQSEDKKSRPNGISGRFSQVFDGRLRSTDRWVSPEETLVSTELLLRNVVESDPRPNDSTENAESPVLDLTIPLLSLSLSLLCFKILFAVGIKHTGCLHAGTRETLAKGQF